MREDVGPRWGTTPPYPPLKADFEHRLTREILLSERFRVTLLALLAGVSMLLFLAVGAVSPELFRLTGELDRLLIGVFLGVVSAYEFVALRAVERLLRTGEPPPALRRYVNALIEVSLPSIAIGYYMTVVEPVDALFLPPAFTYFVFILLSTLRLEFALSAFTGLVAAVEYALLAAFAVTTDGGLTTHGGMASFSHHAGKAAILLVSGIAAGFVARQLRKSFVNTLRSVEDRNRIVNVFGQHVSPAVVDRLIAAKADAKSELREVCVMFIDVRNFTAFCEHRGPGEVVDYLNTLFERIVGAVNAHHGIVSKFLGDGCMALFGAPLSEGNACKNAIDAALRALEEIDALVVSGALPPTRLGIGLHAGAVVIGNIGSPQRKEYTVIGDVVNVASRVEALNKDLGSRLLVTEEVWLAAGSDHVATERPPLAVRGRSAPVRIYELA